MAAFNYTEPADTTKVNQAAWEALAPGTYSGWVGKDRHYRQRELPGGVALTAADTTVAAWRGERLGLEALVATTEGVRGLTAKLSGWRDAAGKEVAWPGSQAALMRYVTTNKFRSCGHLPEGLPEYTVNDMIDLPGAAADVKAREVRPVWVTVEVPRDAAPGVYRSELILSAEGKVLAALPVSVDVLGRTLPAPADQDFFLDLWQQPYSVSRWTGTKPWSGEHIEALRPYMEMLARAGQKSATAILFYEPWGEQSNDKFEPMVATVKTKDGSWKYDYSVFDRYVELCDEYGIAEVIECFSMVPWEMKFRYFDEAAGDYRWLDAKAGSGEYEALWSDFLKNFYAHLDRKGWSDRTLVAMDERGLKEMKEARRVAQGAVPGIKMSLAGDYHPDLEPDLDLYTLMIEDFFPAEVLARRKAEGKKSLLYTCCASPAPNMFSNSDPADNAWLPVYARAAGFDGFLHWSFMNWTDNPLEDSRFFLFAPGDTYFVYPDGRSSVRYERMVEGIQLSEKLRILEKELLEKGDLNGYEALQKALLPVRTGAHTRHVSTAKVISDLQREANRR